MLDAGTAKRPTGTAYTSGTEVTTYTTLFSSACKIQGSGLQAQEDEVAARTSVVVPLQLHLPASTAALAAGDVFTVTTPHAVSTVPSGAVYRITAPVEGSFRTARRYTVERVVS